MAGPIAISIIGDNKRLIAAVDGSESRLSRLGRTAGTVGRALSAGLLVGGAAAVYAGVKLFQMGDEANDARDRIANIAGQMDLFGNNVDGVTNRIIAYAEAQARATGVDTNSIKATQAKLLTFKAVAASADVAGGAFDRATNAAIDLAAAGFGSAETNAAQLGKALQDPVKGLTALTKSGVTFTDAEKERIQTLVDSNRLGKAQELVLGAIEKQVGGTAESMAGGFDRMKITAQQLGERVGGWLAPQVDKFAAFLLDKGVPAVKQIIPPIRDFAQQAGAVLGPALQRAGGFIQRLIPIALQIDQALLGAGLNIARQLLPPLMQAGNFLATTFGPVLQTIGTIITGQVVPAVIAVAGFISTQLAPIIVSTATKVGQNLAPVFTAIAGTLQKNVLPAVQQGSAKFREWWPTIQKVVIVVAKLVGGALELSSAILGKVLPPVIRLIGFGLGGLIKAIVATIGSIGKGVGAVISFGRAFVDAVQDVAQFVQGVRTKVGNAVDFVREIPGKITKVFSNAGTLLLQIGGQIIGGLEAGIRAGVDKVMSAVNAIIDKIPKFIRDKLGIHSPSKVMADIAKWIPEGIVVGIHAGAGGVRDAMGHLGELIADAFQEKFDKKIDPKRLRKIMAGFEDEAKKLRGLAKQYAEVATKLAKARELATSVAGSAKDFANITSIEGGDDGLDAGEVVAGLQAKLDAIKAFTANIDALRQQGLNQQTIDQIIAAGVEQGSATAAALVAGGPQAIQQVNALQSQIGVAADQLGNVAAVNMYGVGTQAADGFITGLEADAARLDKAARRIAKKMIKAIKDELGIASPSKVARGIIRNVTDGLVLQTYVDGNRVKRAGQLTAKALTDGFDRPQLTADAIATGVSAGGSTTVQILVEVAPTADKVAIGKEVQSALDAYYESGGRVSARG